MKFLVDAQLPPGLCRWLQARGHEAEHVGAGALADAEIAGERKRKRRS
jgi:predicted nuclease of predicted toxin-antitoxin system